MFYELVYYMCLQSVNFYISLIERKIVDLCYNETFFLSNLIKLTIKKKSLVIRRILYFKR